MLYPRIKFVVPSIGSKTNRSPTEICSVSSSVTNATPGAIFSSPLFEKFEEEDSIKQEETTVEEVKMATMTIDGKEYSFYEGETWGEWVVRYLDEFAIGNNPTGTLDEISKKGANYMFICKDNTPVKVSEVIEENTAYVLFAPYGG